MFCVLSNELAALSTVFLCVSTRISVLRLNQIHLPFNSVEIGASCSVYELELLIGSGYGFFKLSSVAEFQL